jgi:hypothetical protein
MRLFFGGAYVVEIFSGNRLAVDHCNGTGLAGRGTTGRSLPHTNQAADAIRSRGPEHRHGSHRKSKRQLLHIVQRIGQPSDAWRCSSGNGILDPCYQRILGDEKQLACPVGGPWPANVVLLTLTQPLPSEPRKDVSRADTLPWALELANSQRCTLMTGAMPPVAGMRINYGCPGGFQVVGDIDRSGPVWRVFFQGGSRSRSSRWM